MYVCVCLYMHVRVWGQGGLLMGIEACTYQNMQEVDKL